MRIRQALKNIPKVLSIEVTTRCNLDCVYCTRKAQQVGNIDISEELIQQIDKEIDKFDRIIICGIGESFLYPEIYKIIEKFKEQKFCIVTNGTVPIDFEKLNKNYNVEMLIFSVDAIDKEKINRISKNYNFGNLIKNFEEYKLYYRKTRRRIQRVLNCTLNEYNTCQILKLVGFAARYKFDTIHFSLPRGKESYIRENQEELKDILSMASKKAAENGIYFVDPFETCCIYLKWITPYISINGDIFPCSETLYTNKKLGNLFNQKFSEIWTSNEYKEFQTGAACVDCKFLSNCRLEFS